MIKVKAKYKNYSILEGVKKYILNDELSDKDLKYLSDKYPKYFTITKIKKEEIEDDINN